MNKVKICYTDRSNIGDAINPFIVRNVLGYEPILSDAYHCEITGIGSGLRRFFIDRRVAESSLLKRTKLIAKRELYQNQVILWSAGFLSKPHGDEFIAKKDIKVASVRGELSRIYVERLLNRPIECTTGDGGLLCSRWIPCERENNYKLGIIPHVKEKKDEIYKQIFRENSDSIIIDVEDDPVKNLKLISSCECVISSSLHGLIIADSYCVPNIHIKYSNKLSGDGFKFRDYYSSFGLEDVYQDINDNHTINVTSIIENYRFDKNMIMKKQEEIIAAFKKYLPNEMRIDR